MIHISNLVFCLQYNYKALGSSGNTNPLGPTLLAFSFFCTITSFQSLLHVVIACYYWISSKLLAYSTIYSARTSKSMASATRAAFKTFIERYDISEPSLDVNGQTVRFKDVVPKEFLTRFGPIDIQRCLYQADRGGSAYVPLDILWEIGRFRRPAILLDTSSYETVDDLALISSRSWAFTCFPAYLSTQRDLLLCCRLTPGIPGSRISHIGPKKTLRRLKSFL